MAMYSDDEREPTMTTAERKLRTAGYGTQIDNGSIVINRSNVEVATHHKKDGSVNYTATDKLAAKVAKVLGWGGFKCQWGGLVLQKNNNGLDSALRDQLGPAYY